MGYGKTIELFFVDGKSSGIVTALLSNWDGKAIKIPRTDIGSCEREDIQGIGVYFLLCEDADGTKSVYIGEAENIRATPPGASLTIGTPPSPSQAATSTKRVSASWRTASWKRRASSAT